MTTATLHAQPMKALAIANERRLARASAKREVRAGRSPISFILDPPVVMENMPLDELLGAQARWGPTRVEKFLRGVRINGNRTLTQLTERQRVLLAQELRRKRGD
jgi:hypothetical protein